MRIEPKTSRVYSHTLLPLNGYLVKRKSAALSSVTKHAMPREFLSLGKRGDTRLLFVRFSPKRECFYSKYFEFSIKRIIFHHFNVVWNVINLVLVTLSTQYAKYMLRLKWYLKVSPRGIGYGQLVSLQLIKLQLFLYTYNYLRKQ